ncbi:MAG: protein kinase [Lachnospiraceae bacterium]|nr:protein kinase [Lachnospiraceae bacterium]
MSDKYPMALASGTVLAGQYIIDRVLGQGGFGITYAATDHKTGNKVAVKEFFPDTMAARQGTTVVSFTGERGESFAYGKDRFLDEAQTLAQFIGNENIVRIHTYFEENGTAYFVMDYVEGTSFDVYIREHGGKLDWEETAKILIPVMDALGAVHAKGIVHRDVTPDNIYITKDGGVKLLDFGAARYSLGDKSRSLDVVLKHGFAPKEQYTRRGKQGPFTDIYALGATFYFALTGKRPPDSIDRIEEDELIPPSRLGARISPAAEEAILMAMNVQPQERFQSMKAFKNAMLISKEEAEKARTEIPQVRQSVPAAGAAVSLTDASVVTNSQTAANTAFVSPSQTISNSQVISPSQTIPNSQVMTPAQPVQDSRTVMPSGTMAGQQAFPDGSLGQDQGMPSPQQPQNMQQGNTQAQQSGNMPGHGQTGLPDPTQGGGYPPKGGAHSGQGGVVPPKKKKSALPIVLALAAVFFLLAIGGIIAVALAAIGLSGRSGDGDDNNTYAEGNIDDDDDDNDNDDNDNDDDNEPDHSSLTGDDDRDSTGDNPGGNVPGGDIQFDPDIDIHLGDNGNGNDEPETAKLKYTVYSGNYGTGLAGATVLLEDEDGFLIDKEVTDSDGRVEFEAEPGEYLLTVTADGYFDRTESWELTSSGLDLIAAMVPEVSGDDFIVIVEWEGNRDLDLCGYNEETGVPTNYWNPTDSGDKGSGVHLGDHGGDMRYEMIYFHDYSYEVQRDIIVFDRTAMDSGSMTSPMESEGVWVAIYTADGMVDSFWADSNHNELGWVPMLIDGGVIYDADPPYISDPGEFDWLY